MYQNIYYDRFNEEIHLWDDALGYHQFKYVPYAYIEDSRDTTHRTMHGRGVRKIHKWSKETETLGILYEYDVRPEMRILIDLYEDSDEISTNHCVFYLDIEVAKGTRYSSPEDATNTVTSISYYDTVSKRFTCLILDVDNRIDASQFTDVEILTFRREADLLQKFLDHWNSIKITIVTGWNVLMYDLLYLYNRLEKVLGKFSGSRLSPINRVDNYTSRRGEKVFKIAGISVLDYMELYKKLSLGERSSYTLNNICMEELKRGKVQYDKDLDHLYKTDPIKFIEYNLEDVKLVIDLDAKLDFIAIAQGVCHAGHVPYEDVFMTSRYMEGSCLTETRRRGVVAIKSDFGGGEKAAGAYVKTSKPGIYQWVYDLDLTALYPSNIISMNISPETKWGKISNWDSKDFVDGVEKRHDIIVFARGKDREYTIQNVASDEMREFILYNKLSVSTNGILYDMRTQGLIPTLCDRWLSERAEFRKKAAEYSKAGDENLSKYYDRKQAIKKVQANSLYGVLLLPIFRFYDRDNGEAVTLTGQEVIHYTTAIANYFYNKELGTEGIDYCLYSDTDSIFYESMPIIRQRYQNYTEEDIPNLTIGVATEVQNFINRAYDVYADKFHCISSHRWNIKQELVSKRAFWGSAKKRYAMWLVRKGTEVLDKPDIKGFDSVKSNFAKIFRKFMNDIIVDILHDANPVSLNNKIIEFKENLKTYPIFDIMSPVSVKDIDKWRPDSGIVHKKGTPIHVKSAMNYNYMLRDLNIKTAPKIQNGDKILWGYLMDNSFNFDTIAVRGYDDPSEVIDFLNRYINKDKIFDSALTKKLQSIWDDLGWGVIVTNKNISKFFDFD